MFNFLGWRGGGGGGVHGIRVIVRHVHTDLRGLVTLQALTHSRAHTHADVWNSTFLNIKVHQNKEIKRS